MEYIILLNIIEFLYIGYHKLGNLRYIKIKIIDKL